MTRAFRLTTLLIVGALLLSSCAAIDAAMGQEARDDWRRTYELPTGEFSVRNVNGRIRIEASSGRTIEVLAQKTGRGATDDLARRGLERIEIREDVSARAVRIETAAPRGADSRSNWNVTFTVRLPSAIAVDVVTVNGGVDLVGLDGRVSARTTNGGIHARGMAGALEASTTNGGIDVEIARLSEGGLRLDYTNGGAVLRLPADARATISASVVNGGIDADGLRLDLLESGRRRLEATLNGGGPTVRVSGVNGGIDLSAR